MERVNHNLDSLRVNIIDPKDEASISKLLDGIAAGFAETALSRAFITEIDKTPPPFPSPSINAERIRRHVTTGIKDGADSGAELAEVGDYSAIAVWETTSYRGKPFSETIRNVGPIREEWRTKIKDLKEKYIGVQADGSLKPFYHLGFLVRNPQVPHVPGAISAVVKPWLKRADDEGVPVWLEATYQHAVEIYQHFGFRLIGIVTIGKGLRNADGWPEAGGSGVKGYAMCYGKLAGNDT